MSKTSAPPLTMRLNALVVQKQESLSCGLVEQNYAVLNHTPLGSKVESEPFRRSPSLEAGVHLHWLLPEELTTGAQQEDGSTQYPAVPNRFLVTRLWKTTTMQCRQWLVTSNSICTNRADGSPSCVLPAEDGFRVAYLGKTEPYPNSSPCQDVLPCPLTVVMPGNPAFAAYYPAGRNVFGMYDTLEDVPEGTMIGYLVCGWLDTQPNTRCAGQVWGLTWGNAVQTEPLFPGAPQFAVGETTAEAMQAIYQCDILRPLMEGKLPAQQQPGEQRELEYSLHQKGFDPHQPQSLYILEKQTDVITDVTKLNRMIEKQHQLSAICRSLRLHIYLYWQLDTEDAHDPFSWGEPWFTEYFTKAKRRLARFEAHLQRLQKQIEKLENDVTAALQAQEIPFKKIAAESYWTPVDPVVLVKDSGRANAVEQRQRTAVLRQCHPQAKGEPLPSSAVCPSQLQDCFFPLLQQVADALGRRQPPVDPPAPWSPLYLEWKADFLWLSPADRRYPLDGWTLQGLDLVPDSPRETQKIPLQGRMLLSGHGPQILSYALHQRAAYSCNKENLLKTAKQTEELDILSQRLSGFHMPFLSQQSSLLLPPFDTGERQQLGNEIAAMVGDCNTAAPNTGAPLCWIRAGGYRLQQLRLVDEYSRVWEFMKDGLHVPQRLQPPAWMQAEVLSPPRLVQPSRLHLQWRRTSDGQRIPLPQIGDELVFGWVVPSMADHSLLVYCPEGQLAGLLHTFANGDKRVLHWQDAPGQKTSLLPSHPQLQAFITGLTRLQCNTQGDPIEELFCCLSGTPGEGVHACDSHTALYEGRVFALARCAIRLELLGAVAPAMRSSQPQIFAGEGEYPVQMGDRCHPLDGLCGFFDLEKEGYSLLHSSYAPADGSYTCRNTMITLRFGFGWKELALLFDPFCPFHIISGFLPVLTCQLAPEFVQWGKKKLLSALQTAPILSLEPPAPPHLPIDLQENTIWTWQEACAVGQWAKASCPIAASQNAWESIGNQHLREGWLVLTENPQPDDCNK